MLTLLLLLASMTMRSPAAAASVVEARPQRVAVVLRVGKVAGGLIESGDRVISQEESARDCELGCAHHIGIAHVAREFPQAKQSELCFRLVDHRFIECDQIADAGVQKLVVVTAPVK